MTNDTNNPASQDARNQAAAVARLVNENIADPHTALQHVEAEQAGRDLARRLNAQRGQIQQPQNAQEGKKS